MAILNTLIASSAVALTILAQAATPVNALAAGAHGLGARHAGVSPNHAGMLKRKRNTHKNRKRCIAQSSPTSTSVASNPTPDSTDSSNNNNNNNSNTNNNNSGNSNTGYTGATAPACSNGGKVGLGWAPDLSSSYIPNAITGNTCYLYNWSAWAPDSSLLQGLKFIPMFWGYDHIDDFNSQVVDSSTNYGIAAAMNEVNQVGQANIAVGDGISLWLQYLLPLRQQKGYYIISPSVTSAPDGLSWLQSFSQGLGGDQQPDGWAVHYYGPTYQGLVDYINSVAAAFPGKDIWLTEFACTDFSGGGQWCNVPDFASKAQAFLDGHPNVRGWFPFGFVGSMQGVQEENRLMNGDGSVTQVGWEYIR